ncbi:MAG: glycosyltransferase family 4 protein [Candidatus Neomarinimicrobiota bacterium]
MKRTVLYLFHVSYFGGGSGCLLRMVRSLDRGSFDPVVVVKADGPLVAALHEEEMEVHIDPAIRAIPYCRSLLSLRHIWQYVRTFASIRRVAYWIRRTQADIVHLNTMLLYPYLLAVRLAGKAGVLHAREHWPEGRHRLQFSLLRYFARRYASAIVAINRTTGNILRLGDKTTIVHDWVDFEGRDEEVDLNAQFGLDPLRHKIFLYLGGIQPIKGALEIVETFLESDLGAEVKLLFVGGIQRRYGLIKGTLRKLLRFLGRPTYSDRIQRLMLKHQGKIVAMPATIQVKSLIEQCYAMVSFATRPHAIIPLVEAAWLGKPSIAADTPEAREYTDNGAGAILVPMNDRHALRAAFENLAANPELAADLGQRGQAYVRNIFDKEWNINLLEGVYRTL